MAAMSQHPLIHGAIAACVVLLGLTAQAAQAGDCDDQICSDRPDFTESSDVVGAGRFQLETGLQSEHDRADSTRTRLLTTPTLLRFGLAEAWELRVESDAWSHQRTADDSGVMRQHGWADASIGAKWHWRDGDQSRGAPAIAWLADAALPTGSHGFGGRGFRPSLRAVFEWELPADWSIGVMPGVVRDSDDRGSRYTAGLLSITLGKDLSDSVGTYVEVAGQQFAARRHGGTVLSLDTGATWRLAKDFQLDFGIARGLNRDTPDWAWTTGLSARF
ncbi:hypothetical protein BH09PSE6_BH09PSE6_27160 [soil metagenome]